MTKEEIKDYITELESVFELSELEEHRINILKVGIYINQLQQENQKYKEVIDKATDKCNKTLDYINNTLLKNNVKVELTELLEIKGGLDIILESLVEDQLKRCNK